MANFHEKKQMDTPSRPADALYVHVPLCQAKCRYCDFYSHPIQPGQTVQTAQAEQVVSALLEELSQERIFLSWPIGSIFVGGGTPTVLTAELLEKLLTPLGQLADKNTEFTVEANPGTVDNDIACALIQAGVNRVSIGAQSFDANLLEFLGRIHQPGHIGQAVKLFRGVGIENIGLDLIYGIPGQSIDAWLKSLDAAINLDVEHISCYALSFEEGTPLHEELTAGHVAEVGDEIQREIFYRTIDKLSSAGFEHYEISNFAKPHKQCKHNLTYWQNREYLGIGPAGCSYLDGERRTNSPDISAYVEALSRAQPAPSSSERIVGREMMAETLMLGLRLAEGVEISNFIERFGASPAEVFPKTFARYISLDALQQTASHVRISTEAMFTSDAILADFFAEL